MYKIKLITFDFFFSATLQTLFSQEMLLKPTFQGAKLIHYIQ